MVQEQDRSVPLINLKLTRQREGLKITELQGLAGVSATAIRELENHRRNYSIELKYKIVNGLNANPRRTKEWTFEEVFPTG